MVISVLVFIGRHWKRNMSIERAHTRMIILIIINNDSVSMWSFAAMTCVCMMGAVLEHYPVSRDLCPSNAFQMQSNAPWSVLLLPTSLCS